MPTWIGIDIGTTSVKAAVLRTAYRKLSLMGLAQAPIDTTVGDARESTVLAIRQAVGLALATTPGSSGGDGYATALDGGLAAIRVVRLPASAQKQVGDVLPFELDGEIPFDVTECVLDYRVLSSGRTSETEADKLEILVAAAPIEQVRARIDLLKEATTLEPERVGVGAMPVSNLVSILPALTTESPVAIVDVGRRSTEVLIMKGGEPVSARMLSCGTEGLPSSAGRLARELRLTIGSYRAAGGAPLARVYLCGGGAFEQGAEAFLSGELEVPVEKLPPPTIEAPTVGATLAEQTPIYARALGLAMGLAARPLGLDLRRGPLSFERGFAWVKEKIPVLAGLSAVIIVSFLFSTWAQLYSLSKERETLEAALAKVSKEVLNEETASAARANELLGQLTNVADDDPMPHTDAFDMLVKFSQALQKPETEQIVHDIEELDVQKGHVTVHGIVGSIPEAQTVATTLKAEHCFSDVKISRTNQVVGGDRQKYVMEFDLKCPEDVKGQKKKDTAAAPSASAGGGK